MTDSNSTNKEYHGVLLVNKPIGCTSHDLIDSLRKILKFRKIGHTGTLDPQAEGLMLICLGKATKLSQFLTSENKRYIATIKLGEVSTTFDSEGELSSIASSAGSKEPTPTQIEEIVNSFKGTSTQSVPIYSAVKVDGKRLYKLARENKEVELPIREITIDCLEIIKNDYPELVIDVTCSKGTYIRSLANDIGLKLEVGGYLKALKRTEIGSFNLENALTIEQIQELHDNDKLDASLLPIDNVLPFSSIVIAENFEKLILQGQQLKRESIFDIEGEFQKGSIVQLKNKKGNLLALGNPLFDSDKIMDISDTEEENNSPLFKYSRVVG